MVRKPAQQNVEIMTNMRGGEGDTRLRSLLTGPEEMNDKGRLFKQITVPVGGSIGYHVHEGESETFYILSGNGQFNDNGAIVPFDTGDVLHTPSGNGHSVQNTGDTPVDMIALILYA